MTEAKETSAATQNWIQTFGYDLYGNRTSTNQFVNGATIDTTPAIDPNTNRFTSSIYHFDKNGNLDRDVTTNNQSRTTVFNGDNKQTEVKDANGTTIARYLFDGEGKRVKKLLYDASAPTVVKEETIFVYSSGKLIAEYSTASPPPAPTTNYTATDMLGSPRVLTNSLGEVVSRRDFLPFGEEVLPDGANRTANQKYVVDGVRQKFTGYQKDEETNLDFAEARMYNNQHARFTAVDPLLASGKSADPQTFNRYVYVLNNPLAYTDVSGLQTGKKKDDTPPVIGGAAPAPALDPNYSPPAPPKPPFVVPVGKAAMESSLLETGVAGPTIGTALAALAAITFLPQSLGTGDVPSPETKQKEKEEDERRRRRGVAFVNVYPPSQVGPRLSVRHYSVTVYLQAELDANSGVGETTELRDDGVHTELVGYPNSTVTQSLGPSGGRNAGSYMVPLEDAKAAQAFQKSQIGATGRYNFSTFSCVTHVGDVLRAGGVQGVGRTAPEVLLFFKSRGVPTDWRARH